MNHYHIEIYDKENGWQPLTTRIRTGFDHGQVKDFPTVYISNEPPKRTAKYHERCTGRITRIVECASPGDDYNFDAIHQAHGGSVGSSRIKKEAEQAKKKADRAAQPPRWETG